MKKASIMEKVQQYIEVMDWHAAITELEKLFSIDQDPLVRVRIGDVRRKIDGVNEAIRDYVCAADLFAERGFVGKALAQYSLALRLDATNEYARTRRETLRTAPTRTHTRCEPGEYCFPGRG